MDNVALQVRRTVRVHWCSLLNRHFQRDFVRLSQYTRKPLRAARESGRFPAGCRRCRRLRRPYSRALRGFGWHTGQLYEERFMKVSRRILVASPAAAQRGQGPPSRP